VAPTFDALISIENIIGGAGNDTLSGDALDNIIIGFGGTDVLDGRAGNDKYILTDAVSNITINDSGTAVDEDILDFSATTIDLIYDNVNIDQFVTYTGNLLFDIQTIANGGLTVTNTSGANAIVVLDPTRSIETYIGGTGDDTFDFGDAAVMANNGRINGREGFDTIDFFDYTTQRTVTLTEVAAIDGFKGSETTAISASFDNINRIFATTTNTDRITGINDVANWFIGETGTPGLSYHTYTVGTATLIFGDESVHNNTVFDIIFAGSQVDNFIIEGEQPVVLLGGADDDVFTFNNDSARVLGNGGFLPAIDGEAGNDTISFAPITTTPRSFDISGDGTIGDEPVDPSGFAGTVTNVAHPATGTTVYTINGFDNINILRGTNATDGDYLRGANQPTRWLLRGANEGTMYNNAPAPYEATPITNVSAPTRILDFFSMENLIGNSAFDQLSFGFDDASVTLPAQNIVLTLDQIDGFDGNVTSSATPMIAGVFENMDEIVGTNNRDSIRGLDKNATWFVNDDNTNNHAKDEYNTGFALVLQSIEDWIAGTATDTLDFTRMVNNVTVTLTGLATLDAGYAGQATDIGGFTGGSFDNFNIIRGNDEAIYNDTLNGTDRASTWYIDSNSLNNDTHTLRDNLTAGTTNHQVIFTGMETLNGGAGDDTINYTGHTAGGATVDLSASTNNATRTTTSNFNITGFNNIVGSLNGDTLTGDNLANIIVGQAGNDVIQGNGGDDVYLFEDAWGADTISDTAGNDTYKFDGLQVGIDVFATATADLTFTTTGDGANTISQNVTAGTNSVTHVGNAIENYIGGSGNDTFAFVNSGGITGTLDGSAVTAGDNTLDYTNYGSAISATVTGAGSITGYAGTATDIGGFDNITNLIGDSANDDTLTGADIANVWTLTAIDAGNLNATMTFSDVEILVGGTNTDNFVLMNGAGVTGSINGTAGTAIDTMDYSNYASAVTVNFETDASTNVANFTAIENFVGSPQIDTLIGENNANVWTITGNNAGNVDTTTTFSAFENITGGTANDNIVFTGNFTLGGVVDGQAGNDTLDYSAYVPTIDITLTGIGAVDGVAGDTASMNTFTNIDTIIGTAGIDNITGANSDNVWKPIANNAGEIDLDAGSLTGIADVVYSAIERITGGTQQDTLNYTAYTTSLTIDLNTGSANDVNGGTAGFVTLNTFENVIGGSADDTLTGDANANILDGRGGVDNILGLGGNDTLIGGTGDDIMDGGLGDDVYGFSDGWGTDTVNDQAGEGVDTISMAEMVFYFNTYAATTTAMTFDIANAIVTDGAYDTLGTCGVNCVTYDNTLTESLTGGAGADNFYFVNGDVVLGSIDGHTGNDTLDYSQLTYDVDLQATSVGTLDGFAGIDNTAPTTITTAWDNIDILRGSSVDGDSFTGINNDARFEIDGTPTYEVTIGATTYIMTFIDFDDLIGGDQSDIFNIDTTETVLTLNGGAGNDFFIIQENASIDVRPTNFAIDGGADIDLLDYSNFNAAVVVNLGTGNGTAINNATNNGFRNIEGFIGSGITNTVIGTNGDDILIGSTGDDNFRGLGGDDILVSLGGNDILDGDGGNDTAFYSAIGAALAIGVDLNINLDTGIVTGTGLTNTLIDIENIVGGLGNDIITGDADDNILSGGDGGDDTLNGGDGDDTYVFNGSFGNDTVTDSDGDDTITFDAFVYNSQYTSPAVTDNLSINIDTSTVLNTTSGTDSVDFSGATIETLISGEGDDTASFSNANTFGTLDMNDGDDTITFGAYGSTVDVILTNGDANGWDGTVTGILNSFTDTENIIASTNAGDSLTGLNSDSTWDWSVTQTYTSNGFTLDFGQFEILNGGTGADDFALNAPAAGVTANGGAGDDNFTIANGVTLDAINGGAGSDSADLSAYASNINIDLTSANAVDGGFDGSFINTAIPTTIANFTSLDDVVGNTTATLSGVDANATFNIDNTGNSYTSTNTMTFDGVANLVGGSADDTFAFVGTGSVLGTINGAAGNDSLDYSAYSNVVTTTLLGSDAEGFDGTSTATAGFDGIDSLIGTGNNDTLITRNVNSTFNIGTSNTYNDGTASVTFASYETVNAGTADDNVVFADGATFNGTINGNAGTDTLDASAYTTPVSIDLTTNSATFNGVTTTVTGFENITGGSGADTLTGDAGDNIIIGGDGNDIINSGGGTDTLDGGLGDETYAFTDGWGDATIVDTLGTNTIDMSAVTAPLTFDFSADTVTDTTNNVNYSGGSIANFIGGQADDTFTFGAGDVVSGTLDGGLGDDALDFSAFTGAIDVVLTALNTAGFDGTISSGGSLIASFANMVALTADAGFTNTITGMNTASDWDVDAGEYVTGGDTFTYTNFAEIYGGTGADTFNMDNNATVNIAGGAGTDTFALSGTAVLTGAFDGQADADTLDITGYTGASTVTLTTSNVNGFGGNIASITGGFAGVDALTGDGAVANVLIGRDVNSTFSITGNNAGTYNDGAQTLTFTGITNLGGGTADDSFAFTGGSSVSGVDGGFGTDTLDYTSATAPITVTTTAVGSLDGFAGTGSNLGTGFDNINIFTATGDANDTFNALDAVNTFDINAGGDVTYTSTNNATLNNFGVLNGAVNNDDSFVFADGATFAGTINAYMGTNTLDMSAYTTPVDTTLTTDANTGNVAGILNSFTGITNLVGSGTGDSLTGTNNTSAWDVDAGLYVNDPTGTPTTLTYTGIANLNGGTGTDVFDISANATANINAGAGNDAIVLSNNAVLTGTVDGGTGTDEINYSGYASAVNVNLSTNSATGTTSVAGIENIVGSNNNDTLTGDNNANNILGLGGDDNIFGLGGNDTINGGFNNNTPDGNDNLDGGAGDDTYVFYDNWGQDIINEALDSGADTLNVSNVTATLDYQFNIGSTVVTDNGLPTPNTITYLSTLTTIVGTPGDDVFVFTGAATVPATIDALTGNDTFDFSAYTGEALDVFLTAVNGTAGGFDGYVNGITGTVIVPAFISLENIIGTTGLGDDRLTGTNAGQTWRFTDTGDSVNEAGETFTFSAFEDLFGGTGDDTFSVEQSAGFAGDIDAGAGIDEISYALYTASGVNVDLDATTATGINSITGFENITGSEQADTLNGSAIANVIRGLGDVDVIDARGGDDIIFGGLGNDDITAGAGNDIINGFDRADTGGFGDNDTLRGGLGDDVYEFYDNWGTDTIIENVAEGDDTLDFSNVTNGIFVRFASITATEGGNTAFHADNHVENVIGSMTGADTFRLEDPAAQIEGYIDGLGGNNVLDLSLTATTDRDIVLTGVGANAGFNGLVQGVVTDFRNIGTIIGNGAETTLTGLDTGTSTWTLEDGTDNNTYENGGVTLEFNNIDNIIGGTGTDNFVVEYTSNADYGSIPSIDGGNGTNTLDLSDWTTPISVVLSGEGSLVGFAGNAGFIATTFVDTFDNINNFIGSSSLGFDEIDGTAMGNTYTVSSVGGGDVTSTNGNNATFSSFDRILGGSLIQDTFIILPTGTLRDTINGQGGNDTIDYSAFSTDIYVNMFDGAATNITGGILNINNAIGGSGDDYFVSNSENNNFTGNDGSDTVDYRTANGGVEINLDPTNGFGRDMPGGSGAGNDILLTIENALGSFFDDIITGNNEDNTFSGMGGNDVINGLGGTDVVDDSWTDADLNVDLGAGTATSTGGTLTPINYILTSIEGFLAGSGNDNITGTNDDNIIGGGLGDDNLNAGGGTNTLDESMEWIPAGPTFITNINKQFRSQNTNVNLTNGTINGIGTDIINGFVNVYTGAGDDNIIGNLLNNIIGAGPGTNTVDGVGGTNTLDESMMTSNTTFNFTGNSPSGVSGNTGGGSNTTFTNISNFIAGTGNDTFVFTEGVNVGNVDGGRGNDRLDYSSFVNAILVDLLNGRATGTTGIANIEGVTGGASLNDTAINVDCANLVAGTYISVENIRCIVIPTVQPTTAPGVFVPVPFVTQLPELGAPPVRARALVVLARSYQLLAIQPRIPTMLVLDNLLDLRAPSIRATEGDFALITPLRNQLADYRRSLTTDRDVMGWVNAVADALFNPSEATRERAITLSYGLLSTLSDNVMASIEREYVTTVPVISAEADFISGMTVSIFAAGNEISDVDGLATVTVSFVIPAEVANRDIAIWYWNETTNTWQEVASTRTNFDDPRYTLRNLPTVLRHWDDMDVMPRGFRDQFTLYGTPSRDLTQGVDFAGRSTISDRASNGLTEIVGRISTTDTRTGTYILVVKD
jgi:Ca2+-binding RTX toxin-like protein